jgi:hypothetical protein
MTSAAACGMAPRRWCGGVRRAGTAVTDITSGSRPGAGCSRWRRGRAEGGTAASAVRPRPAGARPNGAGRVPVARAGAPGAQARTGHAHRRAAVHPGRVRRGGRRQVARRARDLPGRWRLTLYRAPTRVRSPDDRGTLGSAIGRGPITCRARPVRAGVLGCATAPARGRAQECEPETADIGGQSGAAARGPH